MVPNHQPVYHVSYSSQKKETYGWLNPRSSWPASKHPWNTSSPSRTCRAASHSTRPTFTKPGSWCGGDPWIWDIPSEIVPCGIWSQNMLQILRYLVFIQFYTPIQENGHVIANPLSGPHYTGPDCHAFNVVSSEDTAKPQRWLTLRWSMVIHNGCKWS